MPLDATRVQEPAGEHGSSDPDAPPAEPIAVFVVKRRRTLLPHAEQRDVSAQEPRAIDSAAVVPKHLAQAAARVHPARQAVVRAADERQAVLHCAEERARGVLPLGRALAEPAVVGQVHQEISVVVGVFAGEVREDVLETNQHGGLDVRVLAGRTGPPGRPG